jgi:hypothetical protein
MTLWGRLGAAPFLLPSFLLNLPNHHTLPLLPIDKQGLSERS